MRAVMIMFDTLAREFLPNFGNEWIKAPNFERLREKTTTFGNFYGGSMPCMPARRELHTGKYNFLHRGWGPLECFDSSVIEILVENGIYSHLVTDHSHYLEDGGATYHNRYATWEGFRGQEGDRWIPRSEALENNNHHFLNKEGISVVQHFANRTRQLKEENMSSVQAIDAGLDFLEHHKDLDDWFLQIECFDPHEPFYVPEKYRKLYDCVEGEDRPYWPAYRRIDAAENKTDLENMQKEYAALISMCDHHLGRILDYFDEHNMWEDTLIIVNTDHGFLLGEHDWLGKNIAPMYEEIIHIPYFMHVPGKLNHDGEVCDKIGQTIDIPLTLLDYFGIEDQQDRDGKSLLQLLRNEEQENHEDILFGTNGGHVCIYDGRHIYMRASADPSNGPLVNQTLVFTRMRGFFTRDILDNMKMVEGTRFSDGLPMIQIEIPNYIDSYSVGNLLFDMQEDSQQDHPLKNEELEEKMVQKLVAQMNRVAAPKEEFERLGLSQYYKV